MPPAVVNPLMPESLSVPPSCSDSVSQGSTPENQRVGDLRGLQWRINLGVLPSSASIDYLRRATADSRRRYASLRRHLLVDPHTPKRGSNCPDLVIDNPLSQNPDSTWSRFFRNAELERMVDQDLSRLYPEHGSYFQTPGCQGMLRRILLLWCLKHPECGYRQGMHELLAPLLYVLQVDVECLSEIRKLYDNHFTDKFDGLLCQENDLSYSFDFRKSPDLEDEIGSHGDDKKVKNLEELDPMIQKIVLLCDTYGAEGELGVVLSEKFIEHDAYCMFDALLGGAHGLVAMADFFLSSPAAGSHTGLSPVIEASRALYCLLSLVDSPLHSHLVDLGVEPQYFALRWLRVLFGREFSLDSLLIIWDEIFASDNSNVEEGPDDDIDSGIRILHSPRGAFISAMAVAMILQLRSKLLATENATTCLQRLLNFPQNTNIKKLLEKAKSLQALALSTDISIPSSFFDVKSPITRSLTLPSETVSPRTPLNLLPDSYWEEKWRVIHEAEETKKDEAEEQVPTRKKGWTEKVKFSIKRTESDPSPSKVQGSRTESKASFRRSLLQDLNRALGLGEDTEKTHRLETSNEQDNISVRVEGEDQDGGCKDNNCTAEDRFLSGNTGSEENSSSFTDPISLPSEVNDHEIYSEKSSVASNVASNLSFNESNEDSLSSSNVPPLPISSMPENTSQISGCSNDITGNSATVSRERKGNKVGWFWNFGRNNNEVMTEKGGDASEGTKAGNGSSKSHTTSAATCSKSSSVSCEGDSTDQNVMGTLRNLGQSMLENIQVIESVFQQDKGQGTSLESFSKNILVGKGQVTAIAALKELRKISNLLSEM